MSQLHIGIAGSGVIGMLTALRLRDAGHIITLFDTDTHEGKESCTYTGAGMLAPWCELEHSSTLIAELGQDSGARWEHILCSLDQPVHLEREGSLVVAHPDDQADLDHLRHKVSQAAADPAAVMKDVRGAELVDLEPGIADRFSQGLFFPHEGHINNRDLLSALRCQLHADPLANFVYSVRIATTGPRQITFANQVNRTFDYVIDCRGLGAREQLPELRGVRGELIYIRTKDVVLKRPVRLMHPRYPIYIVPRRDNQFVIGATQIESDHKGAVTLRSGLELLSAAYALHPGFAEAEILELRADCRPAFNDNIPRIISSDGHLHINGLFRHGFLLAPVISEMAAEIVAGKHLQEFPQALVTSPA